MGTKGIKRMKDSILIFEFDLAVYAIIINGSIPKTIDFLSMELIFLEGMRLLERRNEEKTRKVRRYFIVPSHPGVTVTKFSTIGVLREWKGLWNNTRGPRHDWGGQGSMRAK